MTKKDSTITRRGFILGVGGLFCAPAIVHVSSIMPVRSLSRFSLDCLDHNGWTVKADFKNLIPIKDFTVDRHGLVNISKPIARGAMICLENVDRTCALDFMYGSQVSGDLCVTVANSDDRWEADVKVWDRQGRA